MLPGQTCEPSQADGYSTGNGTKVTKPLLASRLTPVVTTRNFGTETNNQIMKKILTTMSIGTVLALSPFIIAQDQVSTDASNRLRARLNPVISVDASGQARLDFGPGTANDRFTSQVEIAKNDFDALDITPNNGFADEEVELRIVRDGKVIFRQFLGFSENRPADITFESDVRGPGAPELRVGDRVRVIVNDHFTLRGTFQRD